MTDETAMAMPTKEQLQKFWEWCEVEPHPIYPIGYGFPDVDLNNLFKYAIPKLREHYKEVTASYLPEHYYHGIRPLLERWLDSVEDGNDPAVALFWAIWGVIQAEVKNARPD